VTVRFLNKVELGTGVGAFEFALDDHQGTSSELYHAGSRIYESLLESSVQTLEQPSKNSE
jgi:hypothetical protein